jgi:hypothetical protein
MHSFLVGLIIFLLAFVLVFIWLIRAGIIIDDEADVNLCRATLAVQRTTSLPLWLDSPFSSICKRRFIEIGPDSVTMRNAGTFTIARSMGVWLPRETQASPGTAPTETAREQLLTNGQFVRTTIDKPVTQVEAQSIVAESLRRCWTMGLEGNVKVFDDRSWTNQNVCLLCDEIHVKRTTGNDEAAPIPRIAGDDWLTRYLENTEMPGKTTNDIPETYSLFLDYTGPRATEQYPKAQAFKEQFGLEDNYALTDGSYATLLIRRFKYDFDDGPGTSAAVFVPTNKIRSLCKFVAN